jgi:predicted phosphodiesterase
MLLRVASDLHLESFTGRPYSDLVTQFLPTDERDEQAILVLAGDISSKPDQLIGFIKAAEDQFTEIIFIPGNHSYYRHDYHVWNETMDKRFAAELTKTSWANGCVNQLIRQHVRFLFCTLWGDGGHSLAEQARVNAGLADFYVVKYGDRVFNVHDMMELHRIQKQTLVERLSEPFAGKTVIITHHMPSYTLCHPRFGTEINGGFASDSDDIIHEYEPSVWIHGHGHDQYTRKLYHTQIVCNPAGYRNEWNTEYNKFFEAPVFISLDDLSVTGLKPS